MMPVISLYAPSPNQYFDPYKEPKGNRYNNITQYHHFFLPLDLLFGTGARLEAFDITLEALEDGAADVALLPAVDLTLSSALFCR
jgi:hypothetical protein